MVMNRPMLGDTKRAEDPERSGRLVALHCHALNRRKRTGEPGISDSKQCGIIHQIKVLHQGEGNWEKKNYGCYGGILLKRRCTAKGQRYRCLSMLMLRGIRHC